MASKDLWEPVGEIDIASRMSISDSSYFHDDPLVVSVAGGPYRLSVRYVMESGHKHVAGLRAMLVAGQVARGNVLGRVPIDFGQLGLCDRDAVEKALDALGDERMSEYYRQLNTTDLTAWVSLPGAVRMFIVRPGFGDGMYPVYALNRADGMMGGCRSRLPVMVGPVANTRDMRSVWWVTGVAPMFPPK